MQKEASTFPQDLYTQVSGTFWLLVIHDKQREPDSALTLANRCRVSVCARKQDYYVFGNLEFDAETALRSAFMFKQISRSCCKIQGGRLTSKCKLSFNKRSPKSGWQGQTPLRPFIVYSFHLHNRELGRMDLLRTVQNKDDTYI